MTKVQGRITVRRRPNDGADAVVYRIRPSVTAVYRDKDGTPQPTYVTCEVTRTTGNLTERLSYGKVMFSRNGYTEESIPYSYAEGVTNGVNVKATDKYITFTLYDPSGKLTDSVRVPVTADGKDGDDGKDGENGEDAVRYWLVPSKTSVTFDALEGDYDLATQSVSCAVMRQVGEGQPVSIADESKYGFYVKACHKDESTEWEDDYKVGSEAVISCDDTEFHFDLYVGGVKVDRATVAIVHNGERGEKGQQGLQGCIVRISEWTTGVEYRNDEALTSGTRYLDIAVVTTGVSTFAAYKCRRTHTSSEAVTVTNTYYWEAFNSMAPIYTPLIMAQYAVMRVAQSNQIQVMNEDGTVNAALAGGDYPLWIGSTQPKDANFHVNRNGKAFMREAEIAGRIIAGVAAGQRVELSPDSKAMKIYDSTGNEVSSFEGNYYTDLAKLFSTASGSFVIAKRDYSDYGYGSGVSYGKGYQTLTGVTMGEMTEVDERIILSEVVQSAAAIEVKLSGYLETGYDLTAIPVGGGGSDNSANVVQVVNSSFASLTVKLVTYADKDLKEEVGSIDVVTCTGPMEVMDLKDVKAKSVSGGYHQLVMDIYLYTLGKGPKASAKWGSSVAGKTDLTATYSSDFYVARYFANGFCIGQSESEYLWVYLKGKTGMRLLMESGGYGVDVSSEGFKLKHHSGNWMAMPLPVFKGTATYFLAASTGYDWSDVKSFDGSRPAITRSAAGTLRLTFPETWTKALALSPANLTVHVTGYGKNLGTDAGKTPVHAQIAAITSTYIDVTLSDGATLKDGAFRIDVMHDE